MKKLYIGNLPYSANDDELAEIFAAYKSVVSAKVIFDRNSGRSKGFGFVEFEDDKEADQAIAEMEGKDIGGRTLRVSEARPMRERD